MSRSSSSSSNADKKTDPQQNKGRNSKPHEFVPYEKASEVPIDDSDRTCTDILCTIIGLAFTIIFIIIGFAAFDQDRYIKSSFPTDSDGKLCGVDYPAYPYLYFANPPQIARRVCVTECPSEGDKKLDCKMSQDVGCRFSETPGFEVVFYKSTKEANRIGMFCMPEQEKLRDQVLQNTKLKNKYLFINSLDTIWMSCLIGLGISVVYMLLVQFFPKKMNMIAIFGGIAITFLFAIAVFILSSNAAFKIPVGIAFLVVGVILLLNYLKNKTAFEIQGVFLEWGTRMLSEDKPVFLYVFAFYIFLILFIAMLIWQFRSIWAGGHLIFNKQESIFYQYRSGAAVFGTVLWAVQAIWGLSFLKQAFNYCISGNAVQYYYEDEDMNPKKTLITKHFGSVVAGSFMTGFFALGDYIFDLIKPSSKEDEEDENCWDKVFKSALCMCCTKTFDLVRSDAMAYINLSGNPYCNSARYCEYLCDKSKVLQFSQSCSRTYRLCAHLFVAGIVGIIALIMSAGNIAPLAVMIIVLIMVFNCTFFITIHADAAEAMLIIFLDEQECGKRENERDNPDFDRHNMEHLKQMQFERHNDIKEEIIEIAKQTF